MSLKSGKDWFVFETIIILLFYFLYNVTLNSKLIFEYKNKNEFYLNFLFLRQKNRYALWDYIEKI